MPKKEDASSDIARHSKHGTRQLLRNTLWLLSALMLLAGFAQDAHSPPGWWQSRGVLKTGTGAVDYSPANQGQLKNFARAARDEMLSKNVIMPGHPIDQMVQSWSDDNSKASDYSPANLGQLKAVAKPFYDRFAEVGLRNAGSYPWAGSTRPASDYAPANLGQLKAVFDFTIDLDANNNGIPDAWELRMFGNINHSSSEDADGDGLSNFEEWQLGLDPTKADSDGDGISDSQEIAENTDPNDPSSNSTILLGLRVFTPLSPL